MAVGYNNIDVAAATKAGVMATNTPDVLNETTADFGWALMMAAARRITESEHFLRAGKWKKWSYDSFVGPDIHGATLGIIGMGRIGQAIARRSLGFDMQVRIGGEERSRHRLARSGEEAVLAIGLGQQLIGAVDAVVLVGFDLEMLLQAGQNFREDGAGDEDLGFHAGLVVSVSLSE
jgi:glyoxylate/hydroxypyruvate/2-ketogluconate reductase